MLVPSQVSELEKTTIQRFYFFGTITKRTEEWQPGKRPGQDQELVPTSPTPHPMRRSAVPALGGPATVRGEKSAHCFGGGRLVCLSFCTGVKEEMMSSKEERNASKWMKNTHWTQ